MQKLSLVVSSGDSGAVLSRSDASWCQKVTILPKIYDEKSETPPPTAVMSRDGNQVGTKSCTTLDISFLWSYWSYRCAFSAILLSVSASLCGSLKHLGDGQFSRMGTGGDLEAVR